MLRDFQNRNLQSEEVKKLIASSDDFKNELTALSKRYLRREVKGCNTCFFDAFVKLMLIRDIMPNCQFQLRSGTTLLRDINRKVKNVSKHNVTDELALYYLKTNPNARAMFSIVPKNLDELLEMFDINTMTLVEKKTVVAPVEVAETIQETIQEVEKPVIVQTQNKPKQTRKKRRK